MKFDCYRKELEKYDPAICCFKYILQHRDFIKILKENIIPKIGVCYDNICGFSFPNIYDESEKNEEGYFETGVYFYFYVQDCIISNDVFLKLLNDTSNIFISNNYSEKYIVKNLLDKINNIFIDKN